MNYHKTLFIYLLNKSSVSGEKNVHGFPANYELNNQFKNSFLRFLYLYHLQKKIRSILKNLNELLKNQIICVAFIKEFKTVATYVKFSFQAKFHFTSNQFLI